MKKTINILSLIAYGLFTVTGITYVANKILDSWQDKEPDPPLRHTRKTTVYPDGMYPDRTAEDFNKWSEHIHRQLN